MIKKISVCCVVPTGGHSDMLPQNSSFFQNSRRLPPPPAHPLVSAVSLDIKPSLYKSKLGL